MIKAEWSSETLKDMKRLDERTTQSLSVYALGKACTKNERVSGMSTYDVGHTCKTLLAKICYCAFKLQSTVFCSSNYSVILLAQGNKKIVPIPMALSTLETMAGTLNFVTTPCEPIDEQSPADEVCVHYLNLLRDKLPAFAEVGMTVTIDEANRCCYCLRPASNRGGGVNAGMSKYPINQSGYHAVMKMYYSVRRRKKLAKAKNTPAIAEKI